MITDDSAGEQAAVKKAFQGLEGKQEVSYLLCIVYSPANFIVAFCKESRGFKTSGYCTFFTRRIKAGCKESINNAIKAYMSEKDIKYIQREWLKDNIP
jgi:hypothetical protein